MDDLDQILLTVHIEHRHVNTILYQQYSHLFMSTIRSTMEGSVSKFVCEVDCLHFVSLQLKEESNLFYPDTVHPRYNEPLGVQEISLL